MAQPLPPHHDPDGGYRNPWPTKGTVDPSLLVVFRWQLERLRKEIPPNPNPSQLQRAEPAFAVPRAPVGELRITWVGHATHLLQIGGANLLTDPHWSRRASPVSFAGPARLAPPGVRFDALPPIDAVVISHDHYDHLDDATVRRIHDAFGREVKWFVPLGYRNWLAKRDIDNVVELDWWEEATLTVSGRAMRVVLCPTQHWTKRGIGSSGDRLWGSWAVLDGDRQSVYFAGDSGYCPAFADIGARLGSFDATLLPIGAYEPRWFMKGNHMNPEEAVQAYVDLGARGLFVGMHWGTFRLTDEDPLEPPPRTREAWRANGLPDDDLWIPQHGETRTVRTARAAGSR